MNDKLMTHMRPLPNRKPVKWGGKVRWIPTSFRFAPDLHKFLKDYAAKQNVDASYVVIELLEQLRAFETAKGKGRPR